MASMKNKELSKPLVLIISPALAKANNGNWQTARRWAAFLRPHYRVECSMDWDGASWLQSAPTPPALMIALHARRSAPAIAAYRAMFPQLPLVVVLTGTDLYRDIRSDAAARRSLNIASQLVVLQPSGLDELDPALHDKTRVIYQSAPALRPYRPAPDARYFDVIMIGHLREEKQPATFMQAADLVTAAKVRMLHVGAALDPALGVLAAQTQARQPRYHWLGPLSRARARQRLKRSGVMVIASSMEGGANVIIEAVTCDVPVLASAIPGNRGMLGDDYAGYFPPGDSVALAALIDRIATDAGFYSTLQAQCMARAALFAPALENAAVLDLADNCVRDPSHSSHTRTGNP